MAKTRPKNFTVASYLGATWWGLAFFSLAGAMSAETLTPWIAAGSLTLSAWALLPVSDRWLWLRPRFKVALVFGALATFHGIRIFSIDHDVLLMIAEGLAGFIPAALVRRERGIGYWIAFLSCFLLSLAGVIAEGELNSYSFFIIFLSVGAANLNAAHLYRLTGPSQARIQTLSFRYFRQFITSVISGFAFGALIFFAFPREYSWSNPWGLRQKNRTLGYTNSISLDGSSVNGDSSALAFTVESTDPGWLAGYAKELYFRGNTVDRFDGIHWTSSAKKFSPYRNDRDVRFSKAHAPGITRLKIYKEASTNNNLFYPQVLRSVDLAQRFGGVLADQNANIARNRSDALPFVYEVYVSNPLPIASVGTQNGQGPLRSREKHDRSTAPWHLSRPQRDSLLEVPQKIKDATYFKDWMKEIPFDPGAESIFELTQRLRHNFQKNFKATLIHDMPANTAFETFLAKEKKGHCEYFSTASALYLRAHGIPARVVLGYYGGTFNEISKVDEVRESNAHAWVEFYYPGKGWFTFDPTPLSRVHRTLGFFERATAYYSAARFWFNRYVADYNGRTQVAILQGLVFHRQERKTASNNYLTEVIAFTILVAVSLAVGVVVSRRNRPGPDVPRYYRMFLAKVQRAGFKKETGETYAAFHQRLILAGLDRSLIAELSKFLEIDLYSRLRSQSLLRRRLIQTIHSAKLR